MFRASLLASAFALSFATAPAFATDPVPGVSPAVAPALVPVPAEARASDADIDRLLQVTDMPSMLSGMVKQMTEAQHAMVAEAFGKDIPEAQRAHMQQVLAKSDAIVQKHLSWQTLEPVFRKVYTQVFSKQEVDAMIAFYSSAEGASILKKSPQALALSIREMQPIARETMTEVKAMVDEELAAPKSRRPRS